MQRYESWAHRLLNYLATVTREPFEWGTHDCVTFCADCIKAITGDDPIQGIRGTWSTQRTAFKAMMEYGGTVDLSELCEKVGLTKIEVGRAQRGDIVVCRGEFGDYLSVVVGHTAVGPATDGLRHTPLKFATSAFRV